MANSIERCQNPARRRKKECCLPDNRSQLSIVALLEKRIKGAALDVFETEPLSEDSPLYELDNCLLSPHCADRTAR